MRWIQLSFALLITILTNTASATSVCPFCDAPTLVLAEQVQMCDHLLLGRLTGGTPSTDITAGSSVFEIIDVGFSRQDKFQKGQTIEIPIYVAGKQSALYTLMGPEERLEDWHAPKEINEVGWKYVSEMPLPVTDSDKQIERLEYFLPWFEHADTMISADAFAEFAAAPYSVIKPLREKLPREKILKWLQDPNVAVTRTGFYGLMAGICGEPEDAELLEKKILILDADFRLGIEGVMAGYLLLRGEAGLEVLEDAKMRARTAKNAEGEDVQLPFSETYAVMQALRFMWTYEPDRISKERLKSSMEILLDRQELADLVITDLARWKHWSVQDRLMKLYWDDDFAIPAIRRAIVRFLFYCSQDKGELAEGDPLPEHVVRAEKALAELEEKDPRTVSDAKRFLVR